MNTTENSVSDNKKLTDEQIGKLYRKTNEIIRRVNEGTISYESSLEGMQKIIIEGKAVDYLRVAHGQAEIRIPEHLIDSDAAPFIPGGWSVDEHKTSGLFEFDSAKISLYLSEKQKEGIISGHDLRKDLAGKPVMNANVLDYLLARPELIPEEWKGKHIFFWGTIYCDSFGNLYVRCLHWDGSRWCWGYGCFSDGCASDAPAVLAS